MDDSSDEHSGRAAERPPSPDILHNTRQRSCTNKPKSSPEVAMVVSSDDDEEIFPAQGRKPNVPKTSQMEGDSSHLSKDVMTSSGAPTEQNEDEEVTVLECSQNSGKSDVPMEESQDTDSEQGEVKKAPTLPRIGCQEKIILCLDFDVQAEVTPFQMSTGGFSVSQMLKRMVERYLLSKQCLNTKHEYAIVILKESATWLTGFTSDTQELLKAISEYTEFGPTSKLDLSSLFNTIEQKVPLPMTQRSELSTTVPPYVVRTLLLFGRSFSVPEFQSSKEGYMKLISSPYFFLDLLYIHEPATAENNLCEDIYTVLGNLCEKDNSYVFNVGRNAVKLHNCIAKLLPHPLQRPLQDTANYKLDYFADR